MDEFGRNNNNGYEPHRTDGEKDTQDMVATNLNGSPSTIRQNATHEEETAAELTADDFDRPLRMEENETKMDTQANSTFGWIALGLAIVSFFVWPIILGGAGIIMGFVAKSRDADTLGNTAIIAGAVSIIISLFILPYV